MRTKAADITPKYILINKFNIPTEDFFIYDMSGTEDFAYGSFTSQIQVMLNAPGGIFIESENENDGNLAYRVQEGNAHDGNAAQQYIYNGLLWRKPVSRMGEWRQIKARRRNWEKVSEEEKVEWESIEFWLRETEQIGDGGLRLNLLLS